MPLWLLLVRIVVEGCDTLGKSQSTVTEFASIFPLFVHCPVLLFEPSMAYARGPAARSICNLERLLLIRQRQSFFGNQKREILWIADV